jgi:hypothetical protein
MNRLYHVQYLAEYGCWVIDGPNGHRWTCKPEDTEDRAKGFAKALERAYREGRASVAPHAPLKRKPY